MGVSPVAPAATRSGGRPLLPIMGVVFVAYLIINLAMPVLPLHVHAGLGLGAFTVGIVAGSPFAAALLVIKSRLRFGHRGSASRSAALGSASSQRLSSCCLPPGAGAPHG
jgi:hypothetical protein